MSVKSSTELMLYVVLTMLTLNKAYLLLLLKIRVGIVSRNTATFFFGHSRFSVLLHDDQR